MNKYIYQTSRLVFCGKVYVLGMHRPHGLPDLMYCGTRVMAHVNRLHSNQRLRAINTALEGQAHEDGCAPIVRIVAPPLAHLHEAQLAVQHQRCIVLRVALQDGLNRLEAGGPVVPARHTLPGPDKLQHKGRETARGMT